MPLSKKPVTGMKDIMPNEMQIRDYVIRMIKETYATFGFISIETPCVENIENLTNKQGGENEKLIFKIMKRGEKLNLETASTEADLTDSGLRYDLTVPLARYYSNHAAELPSPFKALQIGNVWRADRPQRGRFRQFCQCDIDILGEASNLAEIDLILATTTLLGKLNFKDFAVRINDRRILKAMAAFSGFGEEDYDNVFIILDKMDKIGIDGVREELVAAGYGSDKADRYMGLFEKLSASGDPVGDLKALLGEAMDAEVSDNLKEIMRMVEDAKQADFALVFDPTLVRGMSYYTGTIFEIEMKEFSSSCGGGGRYDKMIGKFTGNDTPACGFSIGFERIITILLEQDFKVPGAPKKTAFLLEKGMDESRMSEIIKEAQARRAKGDIVLVARMNKNKKFQKELLTNEGYTEIIDYYVRPLEN